MKKILIVLSVFALALTGCEQDETALFLDVNDQENAVAQINGGTILTFNPVEDTENIVLVGVSTLSDTDRTFTISVDEMSTLDESFYNIPTLTGSIPAGTFVGELIINTPVPDGFPPSGAFLRINLESVTGVTLLESSSLTQDLTTTVSCPDVDLSQVVGSAITLENPLLEAFGVPATFSDLRTVAAGPGDNQITIIGGLSPDVGGTDITLTIDPETGFVTEGTDGGVSFVNAGDLIPTSAISGRVLTCINQIIINVDNNTFGPPFASLRLTLEVQP